MDFPTFLTAQINLYWLIKLIPDLLYVTDCPPGCNKFTSSSQQIQEREQKTI